MIRPDAGPPAAAQEIWDRVMAGDAELPGKWDVTTKGALAAVRKDDVAGCAYLAACCFKNAGSSTSGASALAVADNEARDLLWLSAVEPVVCDIPSGQEHLWVLLDGTTGNRSWKPF